MPTNGHPVSIVMIEDDEGHGRLIERNIRRAGVNNEILPFRTGAEALNYLFGPDGSGQGNSGRCLLVLLDLTLPDMGGTTTDDSHEIQRCYDLGANVYITKPVDYDGFANAVRQLGLFFAVMQVPASP